MSGQGWVATAALALWACGAECRAGFLTPGTYDGSGPGGSAHSTVTGTADNALTYTSTVVADRQPIDTVIAWSASGSTQITTVAASLTNNTGSAIGGLNFELGTGTGADFIPLDNTSITFLNVTDLGPFGVADILFIRLILSGGRGVADGDTGTVGFRLNVPDPLAGSDSFTLREFTDAAVPEPSSCALAVLGAAGLLAYARRRRLAA